MSRAAPLPRAHRIDLAQAPSEMERCAASWAQVRPGCAAIAAGEGLVPCRCGGRAAGAVAGLVPAWFGRDCIEGDCQLNGRPSDGR